MEHVFRPREEISRNTYGVATAYARNHEIFELVTKQMQLHRVFISYSHQDKSVVRDIADYLDRQFVVLWDWDFVGGEAFSSSIFRFIERIDAFVLILSKNSVTSEWVTKEIDAALQNDLPIIPVRIDDTPIPKALAHLHVVTLRAQRTLAEADMAIICRDITLQAIAYRRQHPEAENEDFKKYAQRSLENRSAQTSRRNAMSWPLRAIIAPFLWIYSIIADLFGFVIGFPIIGIAIMLILFIFNYLFTDSYSDNLMVQAQLSRKICPSSERLGKLYSQWIDETAEITQFATDSPDEIAIRSKIYGGLLLKVFDEGCFEQEVFSETDKKHFKSFSFFDANTLQSLLEAERMLFETRKIDDLRGSLEKQPDNMGKVDAENRQLLLAHMLETSVGGTPNHVRAAQIFRDLASGGHPLARLAWGLRLVTGNAAPLNMQLGLSEIRAALESGINISDALFFEIDQGDKINVKNFQEVMKSLDLLVTNETASARAPARVVRLLFLKSGIALDGCAPRCAERAAAEYDLMRLERERMHRDVISEPFRNPAEREFQSIVELDRFENWRRVEQARGRFPKIDERQRKAEFYLIDQLARGDIREGSLEYSRAIKIQDRIRQEF